MLQVNLPQSKLLDPLSKKLLQFSFLSSFQQRATTTVKLRCVKNEKRTKRAAGNVARRDFFIYFFFF